MFQNVSDEVTAEAAGKDLSDVADSSCTSGYDNDGSTGYEIFENGFQLAQKAAGQPVFVLISEWGISREQIFHFACDSLAGWL